MIRLALITALTLGLTACGVDGPPKRPTSDTTHPGVTITGTAKVGVTS